MGRSPERLLAWQSRRFQLDAIAGTRRRSLSESGDQAFSDDMQQSPKEQNEHRLVRQAITDLLEAEGIAFKPVEEQAIIRLKHVQHMRTRIHGEMPAGRRPAELLPLLHPTPAVGGFPRSPALDFMLEEEGYDRGWFAGGIGVFHGDQGDVAIGIRSALLDGRKLWIYAGAGIVPGSDPDAEWQEIEAKMQNFLGLVQAKDAIK
jgi:menaquinone-specific isochorismate synthase